jgi:hypothetical protein
MRKRNVLVAALSAVFVTLATVGTLPGLAAAWPDADVATQAPRGQDDQAPATLDDTQSPRGVTAATLDDAQAPRGSSLQARPDDDAQAPRGSRA